MALSVKVALLTCLFFTGGICWLVNQVARPTDGQSQAPTARPTPDAEPSAQTRAPETSERPALLERESPVARSREIPEPASRTVVVPEITLVSGPAGDQPIPPLHNPLLEMRTAAETAQRDMSARQKLDIVPDAIFASEVETETPEVALPTTAYTVRKGDSLSKICRAQYGPQAAKMQRLVLTENPQVARRGKNTLFENETLQLPILEDQSAAAESDIGGMEASDSFVTVILPDPQTEPQPAKPAARPQRTTTAAKAVRTPPKADTVRKSDKSAAGKKSAKADSPKRSRRPVAAAVGKSQNAKSVQAAAAPRGIKSAAATTRRTTAPPPKAASGKRPPNPDKRDARRSTGGNVILARRD